jgi:hypothetical protein
MFVIPFGDPSRIRKRLEAEIHRLRAAGDGDLQGKGIKYQPTEAEEHKVLSKIPQPIPVAGHEEFLDIRLGPRILKTQ